MAGLFALTTRNLTTTKLLSLAFVLLAAGCGSAPVLPAGLEANQSSVELSGVVGGSASGSFSVHNPGRVSVQYKVSSNASWLSVLAGAEGEVSPEGNADVVLVGQCPSSAGSFDTGLTVQAQHYPGLTKVVAVRLVCTTATSPDGDTTEGGNTGIGNEDSTPGNSDGGSDGNSDSNPPAEGTTPAEGGSTDEGTSNEGEGSTDGDNGGDTDGNQGGDTTDGSTGSDGTSSESSSDGDADGETTSGDTGAGDEAGTDEPTTPDDQGGSQEGSDAGDEQVDAGEQAGEEQAGEEQGTDAGQEGSESDANAALQVTTSDLISLQALLKGSAKSSITLRNTGNASFNYSLSTDNGDWISFTSATTGTLEAGDSLVTVDFTASCPNIALTHKGRIAITINGAATPAKVIAVEIRCGN